MEALSYLEVEGPVRFGDIMLLSLTGDLPAPIILSLSIFDFE